jgi:guanylate kinase
LKHTGKLIVIVAPSGTGKSSLLKKLRSEFAFIKWSVSHTTRSPRDGEKDGEDYFFISREEFLEGISQHKFIEWAHVHENYYGTSNEFLHLGLTRGETLLFDLDVQGADHLVKHYPSNTKVIFIAPPSISELEDRLRKRGTEAEKSLQLRLGNAFKELAKKNDYDYLVINDDFDRAYDDLKKIVQDLILKK